MRIAAKLILRLYQRNCYGIIILLRNGEIYQRLEAYISDTIKIADSLRTVVVRLTADYHGDNVLIPVIDRLDVAGWIFWYSCR